MRFELNSLVSSRNLRPGAKSSNADYCSAEVFNALGDTLAVITVPDSALEPLRGDEFLCARALAAA